MMSDESCAFVSFVCALSLDLFTCDLFVKIEERNRRNRTKQSSWVEVRRRPVRKKSRLRMSTVGSW